MSDVLQLVSFDSIRAALGVDPEEIPDERLTSLNLDEVVYSDVGSWLPAANSIETIIEGKDDDAPTSLRNLTYLALVGYVRSCCASYLASSIENWRLTGITDGVVAERRADRIEIQPLVDRFEGLKATYQLRLLGLLGSTSATTRLSIMGRSTPTYDPVTG